MLARAHLVHDPGPWTDELQWFSLRCGTTGIAATLRRLIFTSTIYHLWRERNIRAFDHDQRHPTRLIHTITSDVRSRLTHLAADIDDLPIHSALCDTWGISPTLRRPTTSWVCWTPPEEGRTAIHTDASLRDDMAGLGCCLRDHGGRWLGGAASGVQRRDSILFHELQAILLGMELARSLDLTHIDIWSDSQIAIDIIRTRCAAPWKTWHILSEILHATTHFSSALFHHVPREANRAADFLTHFCDCITEIRIPGHELPEELLRILEADASGALFARVC